jgi:CRISPR-associated endonuclease/helicase Cas3
MLLSRALNRGYAASRPRWPMHFGLLNTDCLWVFDEVQLMGSGLATTSQLEAFRRRLGPKGGRECYSIWMSATLQRDWLATIDFKDGMAALPCIDVTDDLTSTRHDSAIRRRWHAAKPLRRTRATIGDAVALAQEIRTAHRRGTRTIVVMNTVRRARELFDELHRLR